MTDDRTVHDRLARTAARWPDRVFLNVLDETAAAYGIAPGPWTYGAAAAEVAHLADAYRAAGYGIGHRVGLLLENRPDFFRHWLALNGLGSAIVPINPDLRQAELSYLIEHSETALIVSIPQRHKDLARAAPGVPIIAPDAAPPAIAPATGTPDRQTECALLYTSGTTGRPKGCILDNHYFLHTGDWYATLGGALTLHEDPAERMITPLPLFHVNALVFSAMGMMTVGGALTVLDRFHPGTWWDSVRAAEATIIHYLGIMPPLLMKLPEGPGDRDHAVRAGFGAGIEPTLHRAAEDRFGFPWVEGWAMTETGAGGVLITARGPRKPGTACFGRPGNGVEARVIGDDGVEAATDQPGELLVRRAGPDPKAGFFRGYLKDPAATEEAWTGGWLHTGDVASRDADGDLHFIDRKKNIIRRSGENISAAEVEAVLGLLPEIARIAVTPVPDDLRGEEVLALIVAPGAMDRAAAEAIARAALDQMAYYKVPGWIAFVDTLPVTATEKLQRGALRTLATQVMEQDRAFDLRPLKRRVA